MSICQVRTKIKTIDFDDTYKFSFKCPYDSCFDVKSNVKKPTYTTYISYKSHWDTKHLIEGSVYGEFGIRLPSFSNKNTCKNVIDLIQNRALNINSIIIYNNKNNNKAKHKKIPKEYTKYWCPFCEYGDNSKNFRNFIGHLCSTRKHKKYHDEYVDNFNKNNNCNNNVNNNNSANKKSIILSELNRFKPPFKCILNNCNKKFSTLQNLDGHQRRNHLKQFKIIPKKRIRNAKRTKTVNTINKIDPKNIGLVTNKQVKQVKLNEIKNHYINNNNIDDKECNDTDYKTNNNYYNDNGGKNFTIHPNQTGSLMSPIDSFNLCNMAGMDRIDAYKFKNNNIKRHVLKSIEKNKNEFFKQQNCGLYGNNNMNTNRNTVDIEFRINNPNIFTVLNNKIYAYYNQFNNPNIDTVKSPFEILGFTPFTSKNICNSNAQQSLNGLHT